MKTYYYAGGSKIDLEADEEHVAVDRSAAPAALLSGLADADSGSRGSGMFVAPKASISAVDMAALRKAGALRPVYRRDRAMLVPLPEVRVEVDNAKQRNAVKVFLSHATHNMVVAEESEDRFVLKPSSGTSADALKAANDIYEQAHPAASSVRFLQIIPRPSLKR